MSHLKFIETSFNNNSKSKPSFYFFKVPVNSWIEDINDRELLDLIPYFEGLSTIDDVYKILAIKMDDKQDAFFPLFNDLNRTCNSATYDSVDTATAALSLNHIDHLNLKQSITKTTIKRSHNLNETDISLNVISDTNNNNAVVNNKNLLNYCFFVLLF